MPPQQTKHGRLPDPEGGSCDEAWSFFSASVDADASAGSFHLSGQRLLILRPEAIVDLQKHLEETVGLSSKGFLYLAGEKSVREGHALFNGLTRPSAAPEDELSLLIHSVRPLALLGWGRFELASLNSSASRYRVTVESSPIAEAYGESKKAVCHLLAGWIAGAAEQALGRSFLCEETACRSQGKPRCEFLLRPMPYP